MSHLKSKWVGGAVTALTVTCISLGASPHAFAADLAPVYTKAPTASAFAWTGCYAGLHAGGGSMFDSFSNEQGIGAIAGSQLGCNYQIGTLVLGIEGDGWWSGIQTNLDRPSSSASARNKWDADVAARFGLAVDRVLVYGKAGFAAGRFDFAFTNNANFSTTGGATLNGLLVGLGLEYAVSGPWTIKFEYDHVGFGAKSIAFTDCAATCFTDINAESASRDIFKIGANYFFYK